MRIEILSKSYRLDEGLKNIITKKLAKFDKSFTDEAVAKLNLSSSGNNNYKMEITVEADNISVRSAANGDKMNEIIDVILPKIERQIVKARAKFGSKIKKNAFDSPAIYSEEDDDDKKGNVVKVKKFQVSVTTVDNAIEEMELLNHDFFIFVNGENNKVSVLYTMVITD